MTTPVPGTPPPGGRGPGQMYELATVTPPAQANPDMWANAEAARAGFFGSVLSGFASIGMAIGQALADIAAAFLGNYTGNNQALLVISDGMTELNGRLDLMENVSGYGGMIISKNYRFAGGSTFKKIPFDREYGPPKNVVYDKVNNRIILAKGTWNVSLLVSMSNGNGNPVINARINVYKPDGSLYSRRWLKWESQPEGSAFHQVPVIAPESGYYVEVDLTHSALWWHVLGGTERTLLFVNRWDVATTNDAELTNPPDGGDIA